MNQIWKLRLLIIKSMSYRSQLQRELCIFGVLIGFVVFCIIKVILKLTCFRKSAEQPEQAEQQTEDEGEGEWEDESEEEDDQIQSPDRYSAQKDGQLFQTYPVADDVKMVLVVRTDLKMQSGKMAAQCGHATIGSFSNAKNFAEKSEYWHKVVVAWTNVKSSKYQRKEPVKVASEEALLAVQEKCIAAEVPCYVVADAGHTQIAAGSLTVCGIGPVTEAQAKALTGTLLPL